MAQDLLYNGHADGWTVSEFKTLTDALESVHDPATGRLVRKLLWNVESNTVYITLLMQDTARTDIDTVISEIDTTLSNAPNTWDTSDQNFQWG